MIRKNITLPNAAYETINDYAKKIGMSFSEFLRETALKEIEKNESLSLLDFLNATCDYVDIDEQEDIEKLNINFDDLKGKDLLLNEIL